MNDCGDLIRQGRWNCIAHLGAFDVMRNADPAGHVGRKYAGSQGQTPRHYVRPFTGTLQADAYAGFNSIYETGRGARSRLLADVRRKFHELHAVQPNAVTEQARDSAERASALSLRAEKNSVSPVLIAPAMYSTCS